MSKKIRSFRKGDIYMPEKNRHDWDPPRWLDEPVPAMAYFHDEEVEVYEGTTEITNIRLWRDNYRTMLDLEQLKEIKGKPIRDLTDDEIAEHIVKQGLHKIPDLAKSIKSNGVRVPLILSHGKQLIDGNRRFLACKYLMKEEAKQSPLFTRPAVKCLPPRVSKKVKLKVVAEMNFLPEHKEAWPPEVRANFAIGEFRKALKELGDENKAHEYINYHLDVKPSVLRRWQAVMGMIDEYVKYVEKEGRKARQEAQRFGRMKFQFFEEFYNKALYGKRQIKEVDLASEAKELLYKYIRNQEITSMMKVRKLAEIVRYKPARKHLKKPNGNFEVAISIYDDYATPKKAALKITRFCEWLENLSTEEKRDLSVKLRDRLKKAAQKL